MKKETPILREVTSLQEGSDTFLIFDRVKKDFIYPMHFHSEYEINFIYNGTNATRIVGDSSEPIGKYELCIVGPNLFHVWENGKCDLTTDKREVTIQFVQNLFPEELLNRNVFKNIADLLRRSRQGVVFSEETVRRLAPRITAIKSKSGFDIFLELQWLLNEMATSPNQRLLANVKIEDATSAFADERIEKVYRYLNDNYSQKIMLNDMAKLLNISPVSFTRLIKQRTGKSFVDFLNEIRVGYATRLMINSDMNISEICFQCGFNNISNFNRIFKKKQGKTPTDFRETFQGTKTVY